MSTSGSEGSGPALGGGAPEQEDAASSETPPTPFVAAADEAMAGAEIPVAFAAKPLANRDWSPEEDAKLEDPIA